MWISRSPVAAIVNSTGAEGRNEGVAEEVPGDRLDDGDLDAAPGAQLGETVAARRTAAASQRARIPGFFHSLIFQKIDAKSKRNTAVVTWGLASGLGCLACAVLGVGLLTAVMGAGSSTPPPALDVLVSGLVVGAGTNRSRPVGGFPCGTGYFSLLEPPRLDGPERWPPLVVGAGAGVDMGPSPFRDPERGSRLWWPGPGAAGRVVSRSSRSVSTSTAQGNPR